MSPLPWRGFKTELGIERRSKSTGILLFSLLVLVFVSYWGFAVFLQDGVRLRGREEGVEPLKEVEGLIGGRKKEKEAEEGRRASRTVTFTRYDMATLTRCVPRRSAKLLSQSAPVSRSQPSAAPALLGRGLVPQPGPGAGRRCHCPTVKRGFEILNTHAHTHTQRRLHTHWPTDPPWQPP